MAKEKPRCVCCGQETGLLGRYYYRFYGTDQLLCSDCQARYERGDEQERRRLEERMLSSRDLADRETALEGYRRAQAEARAQEEKRLEEQKLLRERTQRQREVLLCCGREMTALGKSQFQLGEYGFFVGHWDNLASGSLELALFRCECCGQIKFFDPGWFSWDK